MARRERMDSETTRVVEQRLQWLLQENGPTPASGARTPRAPDPAPDDEENEAPIPPRRVPRTVSSSRTSIGGAGAVAAAASAFGSFRRLHMVIVATIVLLGILLACWAVLRARPVAIAVTPPAVESTTSASRTPGAAGPGPAGDPGPSPSATELVVHVLGAVKKPGVVRLPDGSRVQDALRKAGGLTSKADPGELNLAQPVADGQQIVVGTKGKPNGEVRDG
ncbi:MAG: SLBB domain-containing protein, partial [Microlunatus sp.]